MSRILIYENMKKDLNYKYLNIKRKYFKNKS